MIHMNGEPTQKRKTYDMSGYVYQPIYYNKWSAINYKLCWTYLCVCVFYFGPHDAIVFLSAKLCYRPKIAEQDVYTAVCQKAPVWLKLCLTKPVSLSTVEAKGIS